MTVSIVACGDSAKEWFKVHCDFSVGVNDCEKWGKPVDHLVVVNNPGSFSPRQENGMTDRLETIIKSHPKKLYIHNSNWKQYFKDRCEIEMISMKPWNGGFQNSRVYYSKTSPFVAITLAVKLGAKKIIIWGVDMLNHPRYRPGHVDKQKNRRFNEEVRAYIDLIDQLRLDHDIEVYTGSDQTILKDDVRVYQP